MNLKEAMKQEWYGQGFNSTPLLLGSAACSCHIMKKYTGLTYTDFLYIFKGSYGDMHYLMQDLKDMNKELNKRLAADKNYFQKAKKEYDMQIEESRKFFLDLKKTDFKKVDETRLFDLLRLASHHISVAAGIAHMIEPFVLTADEEIKGKLAASIKDTKELNQSFITLTSPMQEPFINIYERRLLEIKGLKSSSKNEAIQKLIDDFFWIRNSYAGKHDMTEIEVLEQIASLKPKTRSDLARGKEEILNKYKLDGNLLSSLRALEFLAYWQDERKKNILIAIHHLENLLEELSRRKKIDVMALRFLLPEELAAGKFPVEELASRAKKCIYLYDLKRPIIITDNEYDAFMTNYKKEKHEKVKELSGMTASSGTAIGKVKVCTSIESINNFKSGDVLVASMTRPEYLPAMKKASAIVTDEGGITCHAAIVARELGIPCIIGTKIATKVLKDEDTVEVKANHGRVIILN